MLVFRSWSTLSCNVLSSRVRLCESESVCVYVECMCAHTLVCVCCACVRCACMCVCVCACLLFCVRMSLCEHASCLVHPLIASCKIGKQNKKTYLISFCATELFFFQLLQGKKCKREVIKNLSVEICGDT